MKRFALLVVVLMAGCHAHHPRWQPPTENQPLCIESFDNERGVHDLFAFGPTGELLSHRKRLVDGTVAVVSQLEWASNRIRETSHRAPSGVDYRLGEHGELISVRSEKENADLTWDGTFSPAHSAFDYSWNHLRQPFIYVPLHTAHLTASSRMHETVFDGLLTVRRQYAGKNGWTKVVFEANYRAGRLESARIASEDPSLDPDPPIPGFPPTGVEDSCDWDDAERLVRLTEYMNGGTWREEYEWKDGLLLRSSAPNSEFKWSTRYVYDAEGLEHLETRKEGQLQGGITRYVSCD